MARRDTCGNDCDQGFQVVIGGHIHAFDCFECAIALLAPACAHCGCAIFGHGLEAGGEYYCCAHCARNAGGLASGAD